MHIIMIYSYTVYYTLFESAVVVVKFSMFISLKPESLSDYILFGLVAFVQFDHACNLTQYYFFGALESVLHFLLALNLAYSLDTVWFVE